MHCDFDCLTCVGIVGKGYVLSFGSFEFLSFLPFLHLLLYGGKNRAVAPNRLVTVETQSKWVTNSRYGMEEEDQRSLSFVSCCFQDGRLRFLCDRRLSVPQPTLLNWTLFLCSCRSRQWLQICRPCWLTWPPPVDEAVDCACTDLSETVESILCRVPGGLCLGGRGGGCFGVPTLEEEGVLSAAARGALAGRAGVADALLLADWAEFTEGVTQLGGGVGAEGLLLTRAAFCSDKGGGPGGAGFINIG